MGGRISRSGLRLVAFSAEERILPLRYAQGQDDGLRLRMTECAAQDDGLQQRVINIFVKPPQPVALPRVWSCGFENLRPQPRDETLGQLHLNNVE